MESENRPERQAPRSPRDRRRFAEWEIAHRRVVGELQTRLRGEIEGLFVARSLPSMYAVISAFRAYAQGVFDSNAEFFLEECDTLSEYETRLEHEARGLQRIIGWDIHVSMDAEGSEAPPEGGARLPGLYQQIIGNAVDLRTCVRGVTDYVRFEGFPETEHPRDCYLSKDISQHLQAFLQDRIHKWAAEFQSRRGPLVRLAAVDAETSTVATQKTGADCANVKPSNAVAADTDGTGRGAAEFNSVAETKMTMSKLPPTSAQKIRAKIDRADNFLTDGIKWLPTELQDGKRTKQEVEAILCQKSKEWAWDIFVTILREWAEIGIPPDDFEAIVKGQIESLSTHAEERVAAFVSGFQLSSGEVLRCVREFLPCLIPPYREENRFRFHSVTAEGEAASPSKPTTPQAGGPATRAHAQEQSMKPSKIYAYITPATRAHAQEQSQEAERTVDSAVRSGARAETTFPARASWLKDRLLERGWGNSDPAAYDGPDRKTVQKILRGEAVRNDVLQKLADALSQKHGKVDVLDIPQD